MGKASDKGPWTFGTTQQACIYAKAIITPKRVCMRGDKIRESFINEAF
jgi:hypothetical protein